MGRAKTQTRRAKGAGKGAQRQPSALGSGKGNGVLKRTGLERPDAYTVGPKDTATKSSVVKTNS